MREVVGPTRRLAEFVASISVADIPAEVRQVALRCIVDTAGVILGGVPEEASDLVRRHVATLGATGGSAILGTTQRAAAPSAALATGVAGHVLDFDDTHDSMLGHPSLPVLAAALPLAEQAGASGLELLTAFCIGFQIECAVGAAVNPEHCQRGHHTTGTLGALGAAAAASRLLGLPANQTACAIALAASMAAGLRENFGTMTKSFHAGRAAQNGVEAALLAGMGYTASPSGLEGPAGYGQVLAGRSDGWKVLEGLAREWQILVPGIAVKPYPCGALIHPAIDEVLALVRGHDLSAGAIAAIEVGSNRHTLDCLFHHDPARGIEGKFSMEFCLAAAAVDRAVGIATFADDRVRDPAIRSVMGRVRLYRHPDAERAGYGGAHIILDLRLADGRIFHREPDGASGSPRRPLAREALEAKFRDCAGRVLPAGRIGRALDLLWGLEAVRDVRDIVGVLTP